jgi:hypothetical protein
MEADTVRAIDRHFEALRERMVVRPADADGKRPDTGDADDRDADDRDTRGPGTGTRD